MSTFLARLLIATSFMLCVWAIPAHAQEAPEPPELPEVLEFEGTMGYPVPYICPPKHRYWCGRLAGTVTVWGEDGQRVSRYLRHRSPIVLNGIPVSFLSIRAGDKAKIFYGEGSSFAASLQLERDEDE